MAENKTKPTQIKVSDYIKAQAKERQADCKKLNAICKKASGKTGVMWGASIAGYGLYKYEYASGRTGECCAIGFSSRAVALTVYMMGGLAEQQDQLKKLGKFKTSKGCLYIKKLADVDEKVLEKMLSLSYKRIMTKK